MEHKAIITSVSDKFFPSVINFIGSIKANYPDHPKIYVYDLGLLWPFRKELKRIEGVEVLSMPRFCSFWRSSYTWKCYALAHPKAVLNLYLDAGCQVLRPLQSVFDRIDAHGYLAVAQGKVMEEIVPKEYKRLFPIDQKYYHDDAIAAGIVGFKADSIITPSLDELYDAALCGLTLGLSEGDFRSRRKYYKSPFVRNCKIFRHDTTLISLILRKNLGDMSVDDGEAFCGGLLPPERRSRQLVWNLRLNYRKLDYVDSMYLHKKSDWIIRFNRIVIRGIIFLKHANHAIKKMLGYKGLYRYE